MDVIFVAKKLGDGDGDVKWIALIFGGMGGIAFVDVFRTDAVDDFMNAAIDGSVDFIERILDGSDFLGELGIWILKRGDLGGKVGDAVGMGFFLPFFRRLGLKGFEALFQRGDLGGFLRIGVAKGLLLIPRRGGFIEFGSKFRFTGQIEILMGFLGVGAEFDLIAIGELEDAVVVIGFEQVHGWAANKGSDEEVGRMVIDFDRGADLLDIAEFHDDDSGSHGHSLSLVVGDVDRRRA